MVQNDTVAAGLNYNSIPARVMIIGEQLSSFKTGLSYKSNNFLQSTHGFGA
jgi:hypothetical protein